MSWPMWERLTWRNMLNIEDITKNQLKEKENKYCLELNQINFDEINIILSNLKIIKLLK